MGKTAVGVVVLALLLGAAIAAASEQAAPWSFLEEDDKGIFDHFKRGFKAVTRHVGNAAKKVTSSVSAAVRKVFNHGKSVVQAGVSAVKGAVSMLKLGVNAPKLIKIAKRVIEALEKSGVVSKDPAKDVSQSIKLGTELRECLFRGAKHAPEFGIAALMPGRLQDSLDLADRRMGCVFSKVRAAPFNTRLLREARAQATFIKQRIVAEMSRLKERPLSPAAHSSSSIAFIELEEHEKKGKCDKKAVVLTFSVIDTVVVLLDGLFACFETLAEALGSAVDTVAGVAQVNELGAGFVQFVNGSIELLINLIKTARAVAYASVIGSCGDNIL